MIATRPRSNALLYLGLLAAAILLWLLFGSGLAYAQTPTAATLEWTVGAPLAEVNGYTQAVTVNGTVLTGTPSCVATSPALTTCSIALPALPTTTASTITIANTRGGVTAETRINGLDLSQIPKNANTPKVKVTVTVTIG